MSRLNYFKKLLVVIFLRVIVLGLMGLGVIHIYKAVEGLIINDYLLWQNITISLQIIIEMFVFFQSSSMILGIANSVFEESIELETADLDSYPDLDVYVPIRRVDIDTLEMTIKAIREQDYPQNKLHLFIADDTPEEELSRQYQALADEYNANYIYDPSNKKYKAGMLNIALPKGDSKYIAFFDYDQVPLDGILTHFIEVLEAYPDAPFVQAKKTFRDLYNLSRVWSALLYVQFFETLEKSKMKLNTVLFAGSTAAFRRKAIDDVGGIPEDTFTEDNELTTKLMLNGQFGLFSDVPGSIGTVPYGFSAQISQLWRWSHGGSHVLSNEFTNIIKSDKLSWQQKLDHIGMLSITPILVFVYIYTASFIPLIIFGVDSPRLVIFGVSSLAYIAIAPALTYVIIATAALWQVRKNEQSEFELHHLFGFLFLALATNILILSSGITGIFRIYGPKSDKGRWSRDIRIWPISIGGFILGVILEYYAITWLFDGFSSAIILILIGLTFIPTLPVVMLYNRETVD